MIYKDDLINKIREKCGYTFIDTQAMLDALIEVFQECINNREGIHVRGFGELKYVITKEHEGNKPTKGIKGKTEKILIPETESVRFKLAHDLRNIVKNDYAED
jgi:nucleoid DNA-binding protein